MSGWLKQAWVHAGNTGDLLSSKVIELTTQAPGHQKGLPPVFLVRLHNTFTYCNH